MLFSYHQHYPYNNHCQPEISLETFGSNCRSNTNLIILSRFTPILWFHHKLLIVLSGLQIFFPFQFLSFFSTMLSDFYIDYTLVHYLHKTRTDTMYYITKHAGTCVFITAIISNSEIII